MGFGVGVGIGLSERRRSRVVSWSPVSIAGKVLWLRGDLGTTVTGGHVTAWTDQSGGAMAYSAPAPTTNQPIPATWMAGKSTSAVYFDGNDSLTGTGLILTPTGGAGFTVFIACSFDDTTARCPFSVSTTGGIRVAQNVSGTSKLEDWKVAAAFSTDGAAATTPQNLVYVEQIGPTPNSILWRNGVVTATTLPNTDVLTPTGAAVIGAAVTTTFFKGFIAEIVVTNTRATAGEIAAWNAYSLNRYGV